MRDRDAVLDSAIPTVAAILGDALVRLLFRQAPPYRQVDFPETKSGHVTARMARKLDLSETAGDNPWRRR
jgi:hypothetical protein